MRTMSRSSSVVHSLFGFLVRLSISARVSGEATTMPPSGVLSLSTIVSTTTTAEPTTAYEGPLKHDVVVDYPGGFKPSSVLVISVLSLFMLGVFIAAYVNKRKGVARTYDVSYAQQIIEMDTFNEIDRLDDITIVDTSLLIKAD